MVLPFQTEIMQDPLIAALFFIIAYFLLGAAVKFIDDAFDEKAYSRRIAMILAPIVAIIWAYLMALDPASALLLTAITVGVLVKGKIDNIAFVTATICIYVVYFFIGDWQFILNTVYLVPLIVISIGGVLDEVGNDYIDKHHIYNKGILGKFIHLFFEYRFLMKLVVLAFALFGSFNILFFFAFFLWDVGYEMIMHYSKHTLRKRKFYYDQKASNY